MFTPMLIWLRRQGGAGHPGGGGLAVIRRHEIGVPQIVQLYCLRVEGYLFHNLTHVLDITSTSQLTMKSNLIR